VYVWADGVYFNIRLEEDRLACLVIVGVRPDGRKEVIALFFDFPAGHWIHLRTTNPIESTFSTVKARTRTTKGAGSRKAGLAMAFKSLLSAEKRWQSQCTSPRRSGQSRCRVSKW
jgi:transposase-like protein